MTAHESTSPKTKRRPLTSSQKMLLEDLKNGGILRRRGMHSQVRDLNYWLGGNRTYTQENRQSADNLVAHGLAEWYEYSEEESRTYLATHELRPVLPKEKDPQP